MGTTSATIGNICMASGEPGILRSVEIELENCSIIGIPFFAGILDDGFELWIQQVQTDGSPTSSIVLNLSPPAGVTSIVGIDFAVLLAGSVLKRKRRGYMSAVPCG